MRTRCKNGGPKRKVEEGGHKNFSSSSHHFHFASCAKKCITINIVFSTFLIKVMRQEKGNLAEKFITSFPDNHTVRHKDFVAKK